ncbi:TPA: hypothetical protein ACN35S_004474 [Vibrio parahaemolyticus]
MNEKIEWTKETAQTINEISQLAADSGVPGVGLAGKIAQVAHSRHIQKRFSDFCQISEVDEDFIEKILKNECYSNVLYASLETVRQTHSKIGLAAIALIYKSHWNDESFLIPAMRSFSQISDSTINKFIELYETLSEEQPYLELTNKNGEDVEFHSDYNEAVEFIHRNFFVQTTGASMFASGPMQGRKWDHTEKYYDYCVLAKGYV